MLRHHLPGLRPTAILLASALAGVPLAVAAPAKGAAAEPTEVDTVDPLDEAQRLYERGRASFETADYQTAIASWTAAYQKVLETPDGNQIKVLLIYNIATAREKAFEVSQDPAELRQAKILLGNFEQSISALYGEGEEAEAERLRVQEKIAALDEQLAQLHGSPAEKGPEDPPPADDLRSPVTPTDDPQPDPSAKGLIIGGAVGLSLGVAGLGMMAAGFGIGSGANDISSLDPNDVEGRRDQFNRGRTGNTLAIAGGIAGGVLLVTGAVLLGLGMKRKRASSVTLQPDLGPEGPAVVLRGRF